MRTEVEEFEEVSNDSRFSIRSMVYREKNLKE